MSRRRNGSTPTRSRAPVAPTYNPSPPLRLPRFTPPKFNLRIIEDRRTFHPLGEFRPNLTRSRLDQRRIIEKPSRSNAVYRDPFPSLRLGFAVPEKVAICVRRKQRREALFAKRKTGKGARSRKRLTSKSKEHC